MMEKEAKGLEKTPEKSGIYTPEKSPEDIGNLSPGEWNQLHSSDKPVSDETEKK
jgi:hypothetical protein